MPSPAEAAPSAPPVYPSPAPEQRRVRRWAAAALTVTGLLNLVSATTPPLYRRIKFLQELFPLAVPQAATVLVAVSSLALLLLSRGVRRGQRLAWSIAMALLVVSTVLDLLKGFDIEEGLIAALAAAFLFRHRWAFTASGDRPSLVRGLLTAIGGAGVGVLASTAAVEVRYSRRYHGGGRPSLEHALWVCTQRLAGINASRLAPKGIETPFFDRFMSPSLTALGVGLAVYAMWLAFRPVVLSHRPPPGDFGRAREIVRRHGGDTLAYFSLRDDKRWFFLGDSVVAYAVIGGVCLVSPDPVGPVEERERVWSAFHTFADDHGWPVAVMAAADEWLPIYRRAGMGDIYVGDEAIVDCSKFSLEGGEFKGLRQAVNRVARNGYRMEYYDPTRVGPELRVALRRVMAQNRRGDAERGFSMTLGRIFDADDKGLLLAVAYGPDNEPAAFCHYVPAPGIDGYSLDLMRRTDGPHPNGLIDFVVVSTIRELHRRGLSGLGLNFATLRAVLAGEKGDGVGQKVNRWLLRRMSDSMQIESLWRYNAKFGPVWKPRYAVYDSPEHALPAALAVARAESFFEIPIIGRFLMPDADDPRPGEATSVEELGGRLGSADTEPGCIEPAGDESARDAVGPPVPSIEASTHGRERYGPPEIVVGSSVPAHRGADDTVTGRRPRRPRL
jgi:lysylphosphatidylglycerol synthetase-like protein (DUF2156 family)